MQAQPTGTTGIRALLLSAVLSAFCLQIQAAADEAQDWRDAQAAEIVSAYDTRISDLEARLLRAENSVKGLRTRQVLSNDRAERDHLQRIRAARQEQADDLNRDLSRVIEERRLWSMPKSVLDEEIARLEARHEEDKARISAIRLSLADDLGRDGEEARRSYFNKIAEMDRIRSESVLPEIRRLRELRRARFERPVAESAADPESAIAGKWVDRTCEAYTLSSSNDRFTLTRTVDTSEGRFDRTYIGDYLENALFRIDYAPDLVDLRAAFEGQAGTGELSEEDYRRAIDLGLQFSANIQISGEAEERNALIWPLETDILYEKAEDGETHDVSLSEPRLSEVAIELRPEMADTRLAIVLMRPELEAGELLPVTIATSNLSRCKTLDLDHIKVTGTYVDANGAEIEGYDLVARVPVVNLRPRGWDTSATSGDFATTTTAYLLPERVGRLRVKAELEAGSAQARSAVAVVTGNRPFDTSEILNPAMDDEALSFLDQMEPLGEALDEVTRACKQADRAGPDLCRRMSGLYRQTGILHSLTRAMETPMLKERSLAMENGRAYLEHAQITQDQLYEAQKAADLAQYYRTVAKGYADAASAVSLLRRNLGLASKAGSSTKYWDLGVTIFKNLDALSKSVDYSEKLKAVYGDEPDAPEAKSAAEKVGKLAKDTAKFGLELEAAANKFSALADDFKDPEKRSAARISAGKIVLRVLTVMSDMDVAARVLRIAEDMDTIATSFDIVDDRVAAMQEINRNLERLNRGNREATVMFEEVQACYRKHCGDDSALWNSLPKHDATGLSPQSMQKALLRNATKLKLDLETYDD